MCNADMVPSEVREFRDWDSVGKSLLSAAMTQLNMSAWAYHQDRGEWEALLEGPMRS